MQPLYNQGKILLCVKKSTMRVVLSQTAICSIYLKQYNVNEFATSTVFVQSDFSLTLIPSIAMTQHFLILSYILQLSHCMNLGDISY